MVIRLCARVLFKVMFLEILSDTNKKLSQLSKGQKKKNQDTYFQNKGFFERGVIE